MCRQSGCGCLKPPHPHLYLDLHPVNLCPQSVHHSLPVLQQQLLHLCSAWTGSLAPPAHTGGAGEGSHTKTQASLPTTKHAWGHTHHMSKVRLTQGHHNYVQTETRTCTHSHTCTHDKLTCTHARTTHSCTHASTTRPHLCTDRDTRMHSTHMRARLLHTHVYTHPPTHPQMYTHTHTHTHTHSEYHNCL